MPVGNLVSTDNFYDVGNRTLEWGKMGVLAVEMEAAALYCEAASLGKRALALCSISDHLLTGGGAASGGAGDDLYRHDGDCPGDGGADGEAVRERRKRLPRYGWPPDLPAGGPGTIRGSVFKGSARGTRGLPRGTVSAYKMRGAAYAAPRFLCGQEFSCPAERESQGSRRAS